MSGAAKKDDREVVVASNVGEAIRSINNGGFDVVVTDLQMDYIERAASWMLL